MSNNSTRKELEEQESAYPLGGNTFGNASGNWLPLYVGRMIHQFDHRAASVEVNEANLHNAALSGAVTEEQKSDPDFVPTPQYWVPESEVDLPSGIEWTIAFRDIARATDARTMIAAIVPKAGFGNKAPLLFPEDVDAYRACADLIVANLNSLALDFVARSKVHSTSVNWFIAEQFPMILPDQFENVHFGAKSAALSCAPSSMPFSSTSTASPTATTFATSIRHSRSSSVKRNPPIRAKCQLPGRSL